MIYKNGHKVIPYKGDYQPIKLYRDGHLISSAKKTTDSGKSLSVFSEFKSPLVAKLNGNTEKVLDKSYKAGEIAGYSEIYDDDGLPTEYQRVEYLLFRGTGTGYVSGDPNIKTNVRPFNFCDDEVTIDLEVIPLAAFNYNSLWCLDTDANAYESWVDSTGFFRIRIATDYGPEIKSFNLTEYTQWKKMNIHILRNGTYADINGEILNFSGTINANNGKFGIGAVGGNIGCNAKYGKLIIRKNGVTLFNGIPCRRKLDDVSGMWDTISKTFLVNQGSGTITAGPDVL